MIAVVNDVSFEYQFDTIKNAIDYMHRFLDICKRIETEEVTNIQEIRTGVIDTQVNIAPDYKLIQLIQEFKEREERSFLLSILTNRGTYMADEECDCLIAGKKSSVCAQAIDNFLISLLSNEIFAQSLIRVTIEQNEVELRNISKCEHLDYYRNELGLRRWIANSVKHKPDRDNPYGKGKVGSRMDLDDEEAQELLNQAIYIKGRLYGKKDGKYYAFQNERDINYHGYIADDMGEDIKRKLDAEFR